MKRIKKSILYVFLLMMMVILMPASASAAVRINKKSVTLIKGQTTTLKITGTKSKVKWSSNKKSVAAVNAKGKVTAKKKGTATITAKVGKRKYTCKVKVETPKISKTKLTVIKGKTVTLKISGTSQKVTWKSSNKKIATVTSKGKVKGIKAGSCIITATINGKKYTCKITVKNASKNTGSAQYKSYAIEDGVVVIIKNNYNYTIEVDMDCLFYSSGTMIKKSSDFGYALEAGRECALRAYNFENNWDSYKINLKVKKATNIVGNARNIKVTSNYGDNNVMATVVNNGQRVEFTKIAIVYYSGGKVIGYEDAYADVDNKGDVDYLEFMFPYGYDYQTINPDSYKIYVNSSYRYTWE